MAVEAEQWFTGGANQAMRFGDFPKWAEDLAEGIRGSIDTPKACYALCLPAGHEVLSTFLGDTCGAACSMGGRWVHSLSQFLFCENCSEASHNELSVLGRRSRSK